MTHGVRRRRQLAAAGVWLERLLCQSRLFPRQISPSFAARRCAFLRAPDSFWQPVPAAPPPAVDSARKQQNRHASAHNFDHHHHAANLLVQHPAAASTTLPPLLRASRGLRSLEPALPGSVCFQSPKKNPRRNPAPYVGDAAINFQYERPPGQRRREEHRNMED